LLGFIFHDIQPAVGLKAAQALIMIDTTDTNNAAQDIQKARPAGASHAFRRSSSRAPLAEGPAR
jgi:hypothetical protein